LKVGPPLAINKEVYSGVTTWGEVRQMPQGAKRQGAPQN